MRLWSLSFVIFLRFALGIIYIDRVEVDSNPKFASIVVNFTHDAEGNSITNATITTLIDITKLLIYFKIKLAEDENDKTFRRQFVSSVVDAEKVVCGKQSNGIINRFFDAFVRSADKIFKIPLPSVSQHNLEL